MTTEIRPTPETDALSDSRIGMWAFNLPIDFVRKLERERDSAKMLNRSLLDQLEAKDAQLEAMLKHDAERLESDSIVGSCDCLIKTPEVKYHKPGCKYRLISERDEALSLLAAEKSTRDAIIKKGVGMEQELEAMREAIGVAYESLNVSTTFGTTTKQDQARAKLQPLIKP